MSRGLHQFKSRLKLGRFMFLLVGFLSARLGFSAPVTPPAGVALTDLTDSYGRQFEIGDSLYGGAFDNDVTASAPTGQGTGRWLLKGTSGAVVWDFGRDTPQYVSSYRLMPATASHYIAERNPKNFELLGKNADPELTNGWTTVASEKNQVMQSGKWYYYTVAKPRQFRYYKFNISANNGATDYTGVQEIEFFDVRTPSVSLTDVTVESRFPWNGMIDVSFTVGGTAGKSYGVDLSAKNPVDGTDLRLATVTTPGGDAVGPKLNLVPGRYHYVWNAAANLPFGWTGDAVEVSVNDVSKPCPLSLTGLVPWKTYQTLEGASLRYASDWQGRTSTTAKSRVMAYPVRAVKPEYLVLDLSGGPSATTFPVECLDKIPEGGWSDQYKTSKLVLRRIPAGAFIMGARSSDYPSADNAFLHYTRLTKDFYVGVFEVTQRQWELVMGARPSLFTNKTHYASRPVEQVSYDDIRGTSLGGFWPFCTQVDAGSFLGILRRKSRLSGLDLPTEAQWEYSARAGTTTALGSGKNLTATNQCAHAAEVARYGYNSGWLTRSDGYSFYRNATTAYGTAKVGSYLPNAWGLYDMHGNVWEHCVDHQRDEPFGSIDPPGALDIDTDYRQVRGGCWGGVASELCSGYHRMWVQKGHQRAGRQNYTGFRLCLQLMGDELPDLSGGEILLERTGNGECNWRPSRPGLYYLTHEIVEEGSVVDFESAWFDVGGTAIRFEPEGELVAGTGIRISAGDGWEIRYTTDGSAPTTESPLYAGPVVLSATTTLRAIAVRGDGLIGGEARQEFTLHPALEVSAVRAAPRYPWNGLVDIDFALQGETGRRYSVEFSATDGSAQTNLPISTVWQNGGTMTNAALWLAPGTHHFQWDAQADIRQDRTFDRVSIHVKAEKKVSDGFRRRLTLSADGYGGASTLTNVPVLVRLSTAIPGFCYEDFASPETGDDLMFCNMDETEVYPCEIDEWNRAGESLVWVRLPRLGPGTRFKCLYGRSGGSAEGMSSAADVWDDYAGVWHLGEFDGMAVDSTRHGLDATPISGPNGSVLAMTASPQGACGRCRVNATGSVTGGNALQIPAYDALELGASFTVSGWFRVDGNEECQDLLVRNNGDDGGDERWNGLGWGARLVADSKTLQVLGGRSTPVLACQIPDMKVWRQLVLVYEGLSVRCYVDGVWVQTGEIPALADNKSELGIGGWPNGLVDGHSMSGSYDEIRLRGGSLTADRIKADYDMIANRAFLSYGAVRAGCEEAVK